MQTMRVIARVENFACPDSFAEMTRNGKLPVGEVVELHNDMAHVLKGLRNGSLDPADEATAIKAGPKVLERWVAMQADAAKAAKAAKKGSDQ